MSFPYLKLLFFDEEQFWLESIGKSHGVQHIFSKSFYIHFYHQTKIQQYPYSSPKTQIKLYQLDIEAAQAISAY